MKYRTIEGEVLDEICARYYGVGAFDIRKVYDANFGLAAYGAVLPAGLVIELPDQPTNDTRIDLISLTD
jgi:phage tail protein X